MNQDRAQHLSDADLDLRKYLVRVAAVLGEVLPDSLAGLYVRGSLAAGTYRRRYSEIALVIVVERALSAAEREDLAGAAVRLAGERPVPGDFLLSVIEERYARSFVDPLPYEMRYALQPHRGASEELAAELVDVRARGLVLVGPPAAQMFGPVPWYAFINALRERLASAMTGASRHPVEAILDGCSILAATTSNVTALTPPEEAAASALETIPQTHRAMVKDALQVYRGTKSFDDVVFHKREMEEFFAYVAERAQPAFARAGDTGDDDE